MQTKFKKIKYQMVTMMILLAATAGANARMGTADGGSSGGGGGVVLTQPPGTQALVDILPQIRRSLFEEFRTIPKDKLPYADRLLDASPNIFDAILSKGIEIQQSKACKDANGNDADGSIHASNPNKICISAFNLGSKTTWQTYVIQTLAITVHEYSHLVGLNEEEAGNLQQFILERHNWAYSREWLEPIGKVPVAEDEMKAGSFDWIAKMNRIIDKYEWEDITPIVGRLTDLYQSMGSNVGFGTKGVMLRDEITVRSLMLHEGALYVGGQPDYTTARYTEAWGSLDEMSIKEYANNRTDFTRPFGILNHPKLSDSPAKRITDRASFDIEMQRVVVLVNDFFAYQEKIISLGLD